ncbi:MAG: hypothetical protein ACLP8S_10485 [Solirubrobacteraceae bacterium]
MIAHRGPGNHDTVLLREAIGDSLRGVPLLARRRLVGDQDLIDPLPPRAQRRRRPTLRPLRSGGTDDSSAWRTVRRCTPYLRANACVDNPSNS